MGSNAHHVTPLAPTAFSPRGTNRAGVSRLKGLHRALSRGQCEAELLEEAADLICDTLQLEDCSILEFLPDTGKLSSRVARGCLENDELSLDTHWSAHFKVALESAEPVLIHSAPDQSDTGLPQTAGHATSALLVPVFTRDTVGGVVAVFTRASAGFSVSQIDFVQSLSDFIALVLQREKAGRALRESELKCELMVEGSDDIFFYSHDNLHIVQYASPSLQRVLGYAPHEVIGHLSEEFFLEDPTNDIAVELTDIALRSGIRQRPYLAVLRHKNGQRVILETREAPIIQDGRVVGMQGFARDVTGSVSDQKDSVERTLHPHAPSQDISLGQQPQRSLKEDSFRLLQAQNEERRRIARDLHDSTGQILAALTMNLGALAHSCASKISDAEKKRLLDSFGLAEQCARELRTASYLLHPPLLEKAGLSSALKWYAAGFSSRSGIKVNLHVPPDIKRLPRNVEVALFRIIQEALTNVQRHSHSSTVRIRLELEHNLLHLEISDCGIGLSQRHTGQNKNDAPSGVGITGMFERVRELGGQFEISSHRGTAIRAVLPLSAQA